MKKRMIFGFAFVIFVLAIYPAQASAQLFRRRAAAEEEDEKGAHGAKSHLPEYSSAPYMKSGLPIIEVSADIKNEMQGRTLVKPAPDFSQHTIVERNSAVIYKALKPVPNTKEGTRVQPPVQQISSDMYDLFFNQNTVRQASESKEPLSQIQIDGDLLHSVSVNYMGAIRGLPSGIGFFYNQYRFVTINFFNNFITH